MNERPSVRTAWQPVAVYFLLACAISGPFFYWRSVLDWKGYHGPGFLKTVAYMWGPGLAGIICHLLYRKRFRKEITLVGRSAWKSAVVWVAPLLVLAALGLRQPNGAIDRTTPLTLLGFGFLTIWGEEVGWRWFLQDYLQALKPWKKYVLIGVLWELWHFRFFDRTLPQYLLFELAAGIPLVLVLSTLIGRATDWTKSLTVAATLHAWVDLPLEFPQASTFIATGIAVLLCAWFCWTEARKRASADGALRVEPAPVHDH